MRINFRIIWLALPLVFGACSDSSDADTRPATETISVSVGSGPKIDIESEDKSRTQLGEDGVSVKWASDDQIALWAVNSRSETVFSKQAFKLYHYNTDYNTAKFRGDIPQMPADTYTYYAVSPVPSESDGTQATYLIPDVQDGGFNGDWDVMVADPVKAPALEKNDTGETVQFQFRHKVHVLKIRIPKNDLGEKVSEITLAFPQPVTGRMTVDAADPDAAPTLTDGNNTLTLRFDTPKGADDVVFAVIAPVELTAEQPVTITAICEAGESEPRNIPGKHFSEGHTTPIAYHIPAIGRYYTRLNFSLPADKGTATLGEAVGKITLTAPEGSLFDNGTNICQFTPDARELGTMDIPARFDLCNIEGFEDTNGTMHPAEDVREKISALGFPIEDAVKDKSSIRLKIDKMFTGLLTGFPGNNNFILTVTENNGLSTTKTLKYYVPAN